MVLLISVNLNSLYFNVLNRVFSVICAFKASSSCAVKRPSYCSTLSCAKSTCAAVNLLVALPLGFPSTIFIKLNCPEALTLLALILLLLVLAIKSGSELSATV